MPRRDSCSNPLLRNGSYDSRERAEGPAENNTMMETRKRITDYIDSLDQLLFHLADQVWVNPLLDRLMLALSAAGRLGSLWLVLVRDNGGCR